MRYYFSIALVFLVLTQYPLFAQEEDEFITINTPLTVDLDEEEEEQRVAPKKKKRKKKVFYGIKTKKGFTKSGYGDNLQIETFYYLKDPLPIDPYVRDVYWFDFRRRKIQKSRRIDPDYGVILHGPYKRLIGDQVVEEGIFYIGTKHGRWTEYNRKDILVNKEKYYKGWPKESLARYYDKERTRIREIIPVEYGVKEGYYYYFYENGNIAVRGEYKDDRKVGEWIEYWPNRGRRKKIIQYRDDPYNETFRPYTVKEWAANGSLVFDREAWQREIKAGITRN